MGMFQIIGKNNGRHTEINPIHIWAVFCWFLDTIIVHLAIKCTQKIVCTVFLKIFIKVYDPVNVTGVILTFFLIDFMTFLLILI